MGLHRGHRKKPVAMQDESGGRFKGNRLCRTGQAVYEGEFAQDIALAHLAQHQIFAFGRSQCHPHLAGQNGQHLIAWIAKLEKQALGGPVPNVSMLGK